ncbi:MAG: PAS domain S-box protein [Candidatus Omnitrophica bacterium]|nr:PAS domain S-box protein [Candidatus Omnitrophota bacterium]
MEQAKAKYNIGIRRRIGFTFLVFCGFVILCALLFSRFWILSSSERAKIRILKQGYDSLMFLFDSRRAMLEVVAKAYSGDQDIIGIISERERRFSSEFLLSLREKYGLDCIAVLNSLGRVEAGDVGFLSNNFNLELVKLVSTSGIVSGFWNAPDAKLWFFVSTPLLPPAHTAGREGVLILGYLLDNKFEKSISLQLGLNIGFFHSSSFYNEDILAPQSRDSSLLNSWKELQHTQKPFLVRKDLSGDMGLGFSLDALLRDFRGDPIGVLRITDPAEVVLFPSRDILFLLWFTVSFLSFAFVLMFRFLTRHITVPLVKLKAEINEITASGDLSKRLTIGPADEIGGLISEFNGMLDILEKMNRKIKNASEELSILYGDLLEQKRFTSEILAMAPSIVLMLLPDGRIKYINEAVEVITGFKVEESLGHIWFDQFISLVNRSQIKIVFDDILRGNIEPHRQKESAVLTKDGHERIVLWNNSVLKNADGEVTAILAVGQDITELKLMQSKLLKKISDLERFYRISMDREKAVLALKEQVSELKLKAGGLQEKGEKLT